MKKHAFLAVGAIAALSLVACSAADAAGPAEITPGQATGSITYESWTPTAEVFDNVVAAFTSQNPDVEITGTLSPYEDYLTSLQTQLKSGAGPDVFVVQPGAVLNQFKQYIEPLDNYATAFEGDGWEDAYNAEPLERAQVDGVTYGLPVGYGVAGFLWVNKTLLDQAGVAVPGTYDELVDAAQKLNAAGIETIALGAKDSWQDVDYFLSIAASIDPDALYAALEGTGPWTDPALVKAFDTWAGLFSDGLVQDGAAGAATYTDAYDLFVDGQAAFFANGSWNLDMYVNSLDLVSRFDIDAIALPVPGMDDGAPITGDVSGIVVVNKASENKEAAYQLASFMSQGDGAQILLDAALDFPVTQDGKTPTALPEQAGPARASIEKLIADQLVGYRQVPSATVSEALGAALIGIATGGTTGEDAAQRVQDAADNA